MDYSQLISIENLFQAWEEFKKGKRSKPDVMFFERNLEDNLFNLHQELTKGTYRHGRYTEFYVNDPKRRHIHKAKVADRIVHHALYKYLYNLFDKTFLYDSYSSRIGKGTHKAVKRLEKFTRIVSKNYTRDCWAQKLDIRKFFESIDHEILKKLIAKRIKDKDIFWLIDEVIDSFPNGIPLGNLTSQIFANIYLNELDQFVKHTLKIKYYIRYADDFVVLYNSLDTLLHCFKTVKQFVESNLLLNIHPDKITIRKLIWGIDFCGYIVLLHYVQIKTKTKRRIFKKVSSQNISYQSLQSYLGYFSHAKSYKISQELKNHFYLKTEAHLLTQAPYFARIHIDF
ncbi:hypothetical protein A3A60_01790 [Candidatus Curtissbacteria bacterium RIFCSPLOWO2_01_FULL_42_26]|uniref:Reverse transcriptase domain-containing protein n=1 Tax=Candidatus Curtissbacteria bacterium RIFCSPLOWO2_01_FULL_42_26 TaxID=1797729 RepID=A0A1F5I1F6_9BACT|nr:MAG: hypothetical protein A3A60_01790 [Candidatus Curtissbacteria bacterium RIFCSPLOWO2_01_FULL_42_26]